MKTALRLVAALATLSTVACGGTAVQSDDLKGAWASPTCESIGNDTYLQRAFALTEERWSLTVNAFGDAQCQVKLFSARVGGPYTLEQDSTLVEGATEARFDFDEQFMTPHMQGLADAFQGSKCGSGTWKVGEEQSTAATGCLFFQPISACGSDYDIVKVDGTNLFFGQRPADNNMCSADKRPSALAALPVVKR